jgi:hypothetical protein
MKEDQLREDQRREALARKEAEQPHAEETLPPPTPPRVEEPSAPQIEKAEPRFEESKVEQQPRVDPKTLLESAGLVMIETDRSKAPPQTVSEEPQNLGRPRRERPKQPPSPQEDELVQIETKR